jgi:hypothetical protein
VFPSPIAPPRVLPSREVAMMALPIARLPLRTAHRHCEASGSDHGRNAVSPGRTIGPARMTAACFFSAAYLVPGDRLIITEGVTPVGWALSSRFPRVEHGLTLLSEGRHLSGL